MTLSIIILLSFICLGAGVGVLVAAGVLSGIVLGQFFTWVILFPTLVVAAILVFASPAHIGINHLGSFLQFSALTISLQAGYFAGLMARHFFHAAIDRSIDVVSQLREVSSRGDDSGGGVIDAPR